MQASQAIRPVFAARIAAAIAMLAFVVCTARASEPRVVTDASGRRVEVSDVSRIVTIGGAVTEIVYALGHGEQVVGVDQTSRFPLAARGKPEVGYMRALAAEGVISLAPSLIIAIEGSGPSDVIKILSQAAIPFVLVPEGHDEQAVLRKVRFVAEVLGEYTRGEAMARAIADDFRTMRKLRKRVTDRRSAAFVLALGGGTPTVGGAGTSADGIFRLAGVENAMREVAGYKPATAEATLKAAPQVVVTMIGRNHGVGPKQMFRLPAFVGTPAARHNRLISIPPYYLTFGPRTPQAAHDLAASVYAELEWPSLPVRPWAAPGMAKSK